MSYLSIMLRRNRSTIEPSDFPSMFYTHPQPGICSQIARNTSRKVKPRLRALQTHAKYWHLVIAESLLCPLHFSLNSTSLVRASHVNTFYAPLPPLVSVLLTGFTVLLFSGLFSQWIQGYHSPVTNTHNTFNSVTDPVHTGIATDWTVFIWSSQWPERYK